jgi:hypothetical protein
MEGFRADKRAMAQTPAMRKDLAASTLVDAIAFGVVVADVTD